MRINSDASSIILSENKKAEKRELEVFASRFKKLLESKDRQGLEQAARDFEELFVNLLLKTMRSSLPKSEFIESSFQKEMFEGMLDEAYAKEIAKGQGLGIAKMVMDSFTAYLKNEEEDRGGGFDLRG